MGKVKASMPEAVTDIDAVTPASSPPWDGTPTEAAANMIAASITISETADGRVEYRVPAETYFRVAAMNCITREDIDKVHGHDADYVMASAIVFGSLALSRAAVDDISPELSYVAERGGTIDDVCLEYDLEVGVLSVPEV